MQSVILTPADILGPLTDVELKNAPAKLYAAGNLELLRRGPRVAVVGSRAASNEGLRRARTLAAALVKHDMVVVSGLAAGIDAAAHRTAIESGGKTIAVLGTALNESYPEENAELQAEIMREHLLISQFPEGHPIRRANFPLRNRTMALLTDATVIVEAAEKSGTLHQGWETLRLGRVLFLMESVVENAALTWPKQMINYGAQVLSRSNLEDSIAEIPVMTVRSDESFADLL